VGGAVLLAAVERDVPRYREHYRQLLALGVEVAQGKNLWAEIDVSEMSGLEDQDGQAVPGQRHLLAAARDGSDIGASAPSSGSGSGFSGERTSVTVGALQLGPVSDLSEPLDVSSVP